MLVCWVVKLEQSQLKLNRFIEFMIWLISIVKSVPWTCEHLEEVEKRIRTPWTFMNHNYSCDFHAKDDSHRIFCPFSYSRCTARALQCPYWWLMMLRLRNRTNRCLSMKSLSLRLRGTKQIINLAIS